MPSPAKAIQRIFGQLGGQVRWMLRPCGRAFTDLWTDKCFTQAAAISYYFIVSIFPLLLLLIGVAGFFLEPHETQSKVMSWLSHYFPVGTRLLFRENIQAIVNSRGSISTLSALGLLWSGTLMFDAISEAVNAAWGTGGEIRFLSSKLKSLTLIFVIVAAALLSTLMTTQAALIGQFGSFVASLPGAEWPLQVGRRAFSILWNLIPLLLSAGAFGLAYRLLPRTPVTIRDVWPAAVLASVLWEFSKRGFVWYVTVGADYGRIYGSLSAVLILMLWAYFSSLILSWGAELSAEIWKVRHSTGG
jgi:membrane protein